MVSKDRDHDVAGAGKFMRPGWRMCYMAFLRFLRPAVPAPTTVLRLFTPATKIVMHWQVAGLWCAVRLRPAGARRLGALACGTSCYTSTRSDCGQRLDQARACGLGCDTLIPLCSTPMRRERR